MMIPSVYCHWCWSRSKHLGYSLAHASNKWLLGGSNIILVCTHCQPGCSWLEAGHGAPPGQLWRGSANRRIRRCEERHSCRMLKLNLCGCAKLCAAADKYAQQVLAERMDSSVPLSWQPEEFSSKNFRHVRASPCASCRNTLSGSFSFDTRLWQLFHAGIRTWSHRRRHVMANVLPGCALVSPLSSSTLKVTI